MFILQSYSEGVPNERRSSELWVLLQQTFLFCIWSSQLRPPTRSSLLRLFWILHDFWLLCFSCCSHFFPPGKIRRSGIIPSYISSKTQVPGIAWGCADLDWGRAEAGLPTAWMNTITAVSQLWEGHSSSPDCKCKKGLAMVLRMLNSLVQVIH